MAGRRIRCELGSVGGWAPPVLVGNQLESMMQIDTFAPDFELICS